MKLYFLRYFTVLAEELHFGRAAQRLAITQPPLSSAIKALENELQVRLLLRSSKHVQLTPAGAAFLDEARHILEHVARAKTLAKAVAKGVRGRLDVGVAGSLIYREVPTIVKQFELQHPDIDLVLREMSTAEQIAALVHGQLHAGFVNAPAVPPQLKSLPLSNDEFVLCLPKSHSMAGKPAIDLRNLAEERFVMFARDVAPSNYDNVIAIFNRVGIHPHTVHAARQWLTIVAMVANNLGISIVPRSLAHSKVEGALFVPLSGPEVLAPAMLAWDAAHPDAALTGFVESAARTIRDLRSVRKVSLGGRTLKKSSCGRKA